MRELIGTGSVLTAAYPFQEGNDLVRRLSFHKAADALQVAAAPADELHVVNFVFLVKIENDLLGTSAFCRISDHIFTSSSAN